MPKGYENHIVFASQRTNLLEGGLTIVSNRLPAEWVYTIDDTTGLLHVTAKRTAGGLATGLLSAFGSQGTIDDGHKQWIGSDGGVIGKKARPEVEREGLEEALRVRNGAETHEVGIVRLTQEEFELYYSGFSNGVLWELFHDMPEDGSYDFSDPGSFQAEWNSYQAVNKKFAEAVLQSTIPADKVWVQDYHLMLMGKDFRELDPDRKNQRINFFLHTPFPSMDSFNLLTEEQRVLILEGLLSYDMTGFQTEQNVERFSDAVKAMLPSAVIGQDTDGRLTVTYNDRITVVGAFPISIDPQSFRDTVKTEESMTRGRQYEEEMGGRQIAVSVSRLDPSKGLIEQVDAWDMLMKDYPDLRKDYGLIMSVAPSRLGVPSYFQLQQNLFERVRQINDTHNREFGIGKSIRVLEKGAHEVDLWGLYAVGAMTLVPSHADGMNLVAKEAAAAGREDMTLILGKNAGAAFELGPAGAFLIEPKEIGQFAQTMALALTLPIKERRRRKQQLEEQVFSHTIFDWVNAQKIAGHM